MRLNLFAVVSFLTLIGFAVPAIASGNVDVNDKTFTFNKYKYRRISAESAELGSFGLRKGATTPARYEKLFQGKASAIKGTVMTEVSLSSVKKLEGELGGGYKGVSAKVAASKFASGEYVLVKVELNREQYVNAMNADRAQLQKLADVDGEGRLRVVTSVWIVVTQQEARDIAVSGSATAEFSAAGNTISVTASGSSSKKTNLTVSAGTIFAYELCTVDWADKKKKDRIKFLIVDKVG